MTERGKMADVPFDYQIIRSRRKTIGLEIRPDLKVIVRVPGFLTDRQAALFVEEKKEWILMHLEQMRMKNEKLSGIDSISAKELQMLAGKAGRILPQKVAFYADKLNVSYGRITIRNQKTRWGSCSSKGNLNFNCLLMLAPDEVVDYVVVHELCHRVEMNHSQRFWRLVESIMPDYRGRRQWLKDHGSELMARGGIG